MLKESLVRSGRALLSLHIDDGAPEDLWFSILVPHLGRVRGLEVRRLPRVFLSLPLNSFPSLERYDGWDLEPLPGMTALRQVNFGLWSSMSTAPLSQLPLSQLTCMDISCFQATLSNSYHNVLLLSIVRWASKAVVVA